MDAIYYGTGFVVVNGAIVAMTWTILFILWILAFELVGALIMVLRVKKALAEIGTPVDQPYHTWRVFCRIFGEKHDYICLASGDRVQWPRPWFHPSYESEYEEYYPG